jgi:EAL domain-containing protein (putative c-di-GMP-specific phosphodiesterase class I)
MIRGKRYTPADLLAQADVACHQAKTGGRNRLHFYSASSKEVAEMAADASWSQMIQTALKDDAFVLHYQPIVDLRTRRTVYYEVLVRMLLDEDKLAPPSAFLPAAARFGLTVDIDRWVIRQALSNLAVLRAEHGDIRFTINVSGDTFGSSDCFDYLLHHLKANKLPLDAIVIEITEQIAVADLETAADQMAALARRGCRFAIDDFGSGYCSYNYLRSLPIAFVKIDGSFIANLGEDAVNQKIVSAISQTARAAKCETVAEHVEDYETLLLARKLGVTHAQGYFVGRPAGKLSPGTLPVPLGERSPAAIGAPARRRARDDRSAPG